MVRYLILQMRTLLGERKQENCIENKTSWVYTGFHILHHIHSNYFCAFWAKTIMLNFSPIGILNSTFPVTRVNFAVFWKRVFLYIPSGPWTHYVAQAGLKLQSCLSLCWVLGLQPCATTSNWNFCFVTAYVKIGFPKSTYLRGYWGLNSLPCACEAGAVSLS